MIIIMSSGTLNPTYSLTLKMYLALPAAFYGSNHIQITNDVVLSAGNQYSATHVIIRPYVWRDTKFTVALFLCTVTDFSDGALPIGVKFCTTVRPDIGQVFSHFGG